MARKVLPYPPSPKNVSAELTLPSPEYMKRATMLVLLIVFIMLVYLGLLALCIYGFYWAFTTKAAWPLAVLVFILTAIVFLFFIKTFLSRSSEDPEKLFEVTEDDEPLLFEFIQRICDEIDAPFPKRVFLHPFLGMSAEAPLSLFHLFVPGRWSLNIAMGLVNFFNLSELKAVIAHELGHVAQKASLASYSVAAQRIVASLFTGQDGIDRFLDRHRREQHLGGILCAGIYWIIASIRATLLAMFRLIDSLNFKMAHEREYTCDLFGVRVAGSDAQVHALMRTVFADHCLDLALRDLEAAADHKLYTSDIYFHQTAAGPYVRKNLKKPRMGDRPVLKGPNDGKRIQVFDSDEDAEVPEGDVHPSLFDREENCKRDFVPCETDERSAWMLFEDPEELRERITYKFYRIVHEVRKDVKLSDPEVVQKFIDEEHAEMTYDPKYGGVYDGRFLDPGALEELDELIEKEPWEDDRLSRVEAKLYKGLEKRVEDYNDSRKEWNRLMRDCNWRPRGKTKRIIEDLDKQIEDDSEWFKSFDRRVYLVYMQMARRLPDPEIARELHNRYTFHLPLQDIYRRADKRRDLLQFHHDQLFDRDPNTITPDVVTEAFHEFRQARKGLKEILRDAGELNMPMLKNFTGDEALDEFLLDEKLIKEMPEDYVELKWIFKLWNQLSQVLKKSARLYFKSVGNILAIQEKVAKEFNAMKPPEPITLEPAEEDIPDAIIEEEPQDAQKK